MVPTNKRFIAIYLIVAFIAFALLASRLNGVANNPFVKKFLQVTSSLSKSLMTYDIKLPRPITANEYSKASIGVYTLPGIHGITWQQKKDRLIVRYDSEKVKEIDIRTTIERELGISLAAPAPKPKVDEDVEFLLRMEKEAAQ